MRGPAWSLTAVGTDSRRLPELVHAPWHFQPQKNVTVSVFQSGSGAGGGPSRPTALLVARAEELLGTLPGVVSVRIETALSGDVDCIHVLTSVEVGPKQTVRNIESALMAHLGLRVDHRKISVATTVDAPRIRLTPSSVEPGFTTAAARSPDPANVTNPPDAPILMAAGSSAPAASVVRSGGERRYVFDDVEVTRNRNGLGCRVTLRRGTESFEGEAEGLETDASRLELSARATVLAITFAEGTSGSMALAGAQRVDAFGKEFVFVGVMARQGRSSTLLSGSCTIRDSAEVAGALAVLDATNRWLEASR